MIMNKVITISTTFLVVLISFLGCVNRNEKFDNFDSISFEKQEIFVSHSQHLLSNNLSFSDLIGEDSLIQYQPSNKTFYLFDLRSKTTSVFLQFSDEGPNFMENLILDFDSYKGKHYILSQNFLHIANQNSIIEQRISTNRFNQSPSDGDFRIHKIQVLNESSVLTSKWIRAALYSNVIDEPESSIFAELDPLREDFMSLPIYSPKESQVKNPDLGYFGLSEHYFLKQKCKLIYNFRFSSKIYVFDQCQNQLKEFEAKSSQFSNLKEPLESKFRKDPIKLSEYISSGVNFSSLNYIPKFNLYARILLESSIDASGKFDVISYVQLFDDKFKLKEEIKVAKSIGLNIFTDNNSIYLIPKQEEEGQTKILKYKIRIEP